MDDSISRQAAIDAACNEMDWLDDGCIEERKTMIKSALSELPSARPYLISRTELFNKLATVQAPPEANEYKAEVYKIIQSMGTEEENDEQ